MELSVMDGSPLFHIALVEPEIHPNTGNIARLCAANALPLHLVGDLGFRIDDKAIKRAGLDYWPHVSLHRHANIDALRLSLPASRFFYFSTKAERSYTGVTFSRGDCFVFGAETRGLPEAMLQANWEHALTIPMRSGKVRSLNLATAVAIAAYEALRQVGVSRP